MMVAGRDYVIKPRPVSDAELDEVILRLGDHRPREFRYRETVRRQLELRRSLGEIRDMVCGIAAAEPKAK